MNPVNKILLGVGAVITLGIIVALVWLSLANAHLKTALAQAQENNTACHLANDEFVTQVAQQNKAVEALKMESQIHEKRAQAAVSQARKTAHDFFLAAAKWRRLRPQGDMCQAAENLFNDYREQAR